ncbi:2Fe-2S iron-sulfur cluster binding domain-containing protein [candidate division KSB1 bacterium]|nr:2Fe-2S iron-sulfur cluster binding domain-containing protein [candidate division KSB1 bacterium]NIR68989.1 2Fe-2S iron-sulfur cluster binding domain-containing protein [candidate division KSB1 bacterium]NIS22611.1 2Fe-2S iron-sulfur cluster binding domain-containing protein [candidate division KSB1 bacterium]NIT69471.1 2Fe-2S iron-sulfur cluster binding domain-containing protein [candidate division KSB1 bacterium]NIU23126.1 2Fe-2S iron-sulfur cluster binding domain-containing protein [candid
MTDKRETYQVTLIIDDEQHSLEVPEDETILEAALQADYLLPYLCLQGWCTTCAGQILEGEVDQSQALRIFPEDEEAGYVLLCSAYPRSDLKILTHKKNELKEFRISKKLPVPRG